MHYGNDLGNDLVLGHVGGDPARPLRLTRQQRAMHLYMVGATGTGKSKQMASCIRQDILARPQSKCGLLLLDLHGSLYEDVIDGMVEHDLRHMPLIPIDLSRIDWVIAYNPLRPRPDAEADPAVVIAGFVRAIAHAWGASDLSQTPRLAKWLHVMLATAYEQRASLGEILRMIRSPDYRRGIAAEVRDSVAQAVWQMSGALKEAEFQEQVESTVNRIVKFLSTQVMRTTLCQTGLSLDLSDALRRGAIIPVSLATRGGRIDEEDAITFGSLLLSDLWAAAQLRGKNGVADRPFYLYLDEFQEFVTPVMAKTLDQARGFGLHITLAHQFPSQLLSRGEHGRQVFDSIMGNARTKIAFQTDHPADVTVLAEWLCRNEIDVDAVKYQGYSTKVIGHELRYMTATSRSESDGTNDGVNWSETKSKSLTKGKSQSETESETHSKGTMESHTHTTGESTAIGVGTTESHALALGVQAGRSEGRNTSNGTNWSNTDSESSDQSQGHSLARSVGRSLGDPSDSLREELEDDGEDYDALLDTERDGSGEVVEGEIVYLDKDKTQRLDRATQKVSISQTTTDQDSSSRGLSRSRGHGGSVSNGTNASSSRGLSVGTNHSLGVSKTEQQGWSESDADSYGLSESHSTGLARTTGTNEAKTKGLARSRGGSVGTSHAVTTGTTRSPMLFPVYGREASTPVYRTVAEQLFIATQRLAGQLQRHCLVRMVGDVVPLAIVTPTVPDSHVAPAYRTIWLTRRLKQLPFALPMPEALRRIAARENELGKGDDEPVSNRRVVPAVLAVSPVPLPPSPVPSAPSLLC